MTHCTKIRLIEAYHDGELPPRLLREVEEHLPGCEECRGELSSLRSMSAWLASAPAPAADGEVLRRLADRAAARRQRAAMRTAGALTTAAAAVLVTCSAMLWQGQPASAADTVPAAWESAAVAPIATTAAASLEAPASQDADAELARLILGSLGSGGAGGNGHE